MAREKIEKAFIDRSVYEKGMKLRRELVGDEYAENADAGFDPALIPARETLLDIAWSRVWTRKTIDRRTRSFMTIALLTVLNRPGELGVHIRVGMKNGLTRAEIGEAILHAAAYSGVPAGVGALAVAKQVFKDADAAAKPERTADRRGGKHRNG